MSINNIMADRQKRSSSIRHSSTRLAGVADFLSSEPFALKQHTVAEVERSLRDAGVPEREWLQELQGMAKDGSLQAFLETVEKSLLPKLRCREQEMLADLTLLQQQLCTTQRHTHTHARILLLCYAAAGL